MATPPNQTIKKSTSPPRPGGPSSTAPPDGDRSRSPSPDKPFKVTMDQLIKEGLPDLVVSKPGKRTQKASTAGIYDYEGQFRSWADFDKEVIDLIYPENKPDNTKPILYRPSAAPLALIEKENFVCAEEKGVEGRFTQQAIHIVQVAAILAGLKVKAGDFRGTDEATKETTKKPDFSGMATDARQGVRYVGECKADWENDMHTQYNATTALKDPSMVSTAAPVRKWLLQEAAYMKQLKLQYGFVSTYNYTIFLHYEMTTDLADGDTLQDCVSVSRPIKHSQAYDEHNHLVSVRQGLWFLMLKASSETDWKMKKGKATDKEPMPTRSQKGKDPQGPPPGGSGGPQQKKPATGGGDSSGLSQPMSGLNISDPKQKKSTAAPTTKKATAEPSTSKKTAADPKPPKPTKPVDPNAKPPKKK